MQCGPSSNDYKVLIKIEHNTYFTNQLKHYTSLSQAQYFPFFEKKKKCETNKTKQNWQLHA